MVQLDLVDARRRVLVALHAGTRAAEPSRWVSADTPELAAVGRSTNPAAVEPALTCLERHLGLSPSTVEWDPPEEMRATGLDWSSLRMSTGGSAFAVLSPAVVSDRGRLLHGLLLHAATRAIEAERGMGPTATYAERHAVLVRRGLGLVLASCEGNPDVERGELAVLLAAEARASHRSLEELAPGIEPTLADQVRAELGQPRRVERLGPLLPTAGVAAELLGTLQRFAEHGIRPRPSLRERGPSDSLFPHLVAHLGLAPTVHVLVDREGRQARTARRPDDGDLVVRITGARERTPQAITIGVVGAVAMSHELALRPNDPRLIDLGVWLGVGPLLLAPDVPLDERRIGLALAAAAACTGDEPTYRGDWPEGVVACTDASLEWLTGRPRPRDWKTIAFLLGFALFFASAIYAGLRGNAGYGDRCARDSDCGVVSGLLCDGDVGCRPPCSETPCPSRWQCQPDGHCTRPARRR